MNTLLALLILVSCASIAYYFGVARVGREYDPKRKRHLDKLRKKYGRTGADHAE